MRLCSATRAASLSHCSTSLVQCESSLNVRECCRKGLLDMDTSPICLNLFSAYRPVSWGARTACVSVPWWWWTYAESMPSEKGLGMLGNRSPLVSATMGPDLLLFLPLDVSTVEHKRWIALASRQKHPRRANIHGDKVNPIVPYVSAWHLAF